MSKNKRIKPRNPFVEAIRTGPFKHKIVPNKLHAPEVPGVCTDCGWKYEDCECYGE